MAQEDTNLTSTIDPLAGTGAPELVIGLVGPVGTDLALVTNVLSSALKRVHYDTETIRFSTLLEYIDPLNRDLKFEPEDKRYNTHMTAGTLFRETLGRGDALALLAITAIRESREKISNDPNLPAGRQAYILRSLKHPKEVHSLRDIYGRGFILVSVYSPREIRVERLARSICVSYGESDQSKFRGIAETLINRDEEEENKSLGQDVTDAFPLADFFVDSKNRASIEKSITRFINILFGFPYHTPSRNEFGMFHARAAALSVRPVTL